MKTAVVTGTSYGLGEAIAEILLDNNFKVYGVSRTEPSIRNNNFVWIKADLLDGKSFDLVNSWIVEDKVDLLINNAGMVFAENALEFKNETFQKTFGLNLLAPIKITSILKTKLQNGMVINISSTSDRTPEDSLALYCSSKVALDMYFDVAALENPSIKILHVLPDYADTPLLRNFVGDQDFDWETAVNPNEFSSAFKEIVANESKFETGTKIIVINNKSNDYSKDSEKLYCYNVEIKEFKKLK